MEEDENAPQTHEVSACRSEEERVSSGIILQLQENQLGQIQQCMGLKNDYLDIQVTDSMSFIFLSLGKNYLENPP